MTAIDIVIVSLHVASRVVGQSLVEVLAEGQFEYNKLRQSSITNEISEIVGGANALQ